jgi:hypothetical protein
MNAKEAKELSECSIQDFFNIEICNIEAGIEEAAENGLRHYNHFITLNGDVQQNDKLC